MHCLPSVARPPPEKVEKLREAEKALGVVLVAYERPSILSTLSGSDLEKTQSLEKELGVKLVAFD